ncbi:gliding motility-associated C-terminal domain-containing protein [Aquimarina aquimarini]|uniref:gliding motility-associated C-terminal domain-containing protein n=1 Tax=Aquimarina aquimarini TaxID=1191734 RepID=UPI001F16BAB3|nr:gliding motility-associated C-terminal domain-containing protein [Aquimarina aquimarini]
MQGFLPPLVFFPVCDTNDDCSVGIEIDLDLFDTLESRQGEALPHLNGVWEYTGSLPASEYILDGSSFGATIAKNNGFPIDSKDFTFRYTVGGVGTCATEVVNVKITIVRPVSAGYASEYNICESDISTWDQVIDLRDDQYLNQEDDGGEWDQDGQQITSPTDSQINVKEVYDAFLASPQNTPGYGCVAFLYTYRVGSRSPVCLSSEATVVFRIFEELKPFQQKSPPEEVCPASDTREQMDLFDLLEFTPNYIYTNYSAWTLESRPVGATDLNLQLNTDGALSTEEHLGKIDLNDAIPGRYEFRYTVTPDKDCSAYGIQTLYGGSVCSPSLNDSNPCSSLSTLVILDVLDFNYAGEDTSGVHLCETFNNGEVSLRSLLRDNGSSIATGVWTDTSNGGVVVNDIFTLPSGMITPQNFSFTHTTTHPSGCSDSAILEFSVYKEPDAGEDATGVVCSDNRKVTLFSLLEGTPDPTGIWTGPFGYVSTDHLGVFDINDYTLPILGEGDYIYTVSGNLGCNTPDESVVSISIVEPVVIGNDRSETFCKIDGSVNLYSLLDRDTPRTGVFEDTDNTGALSQDGIVNFETLTNNIYNYRYVLENALPCDQSSLNVAVQIVDLPMPVVPTQEFCILDAAKLEDIEVDVLNYNWYETQESEMPIVDNPILLDNQKYYIATVDTDNCESERLEVWIKILNTGERFTNGELCTLDFQDGVSPNGDNQNDTFDLLIEGVYNIPEAFPEYDLKIYNRYGSLVYEGNNNTDEFRGESNVSVRLGDDLPSGIYFYIFTPNFENNLPIQGSFYLSR